MITADRADSIREGKVLTVAAAMLRYSLPDAGEDSIRLEASRGSDGTLLRLIRPPSSTTPARDGDAGELMMIDAAADRWGAHGGTDLPSTLWALLR
jgi:hypothetical protein